MDILVSPFTKQLFVAGSPLLAGLSVGGAVAYPTVLLHQLKGNDSSIQLDFDTASWLGSIHGLAGLPSILMPTIMQWRGRKFAFIAACLISITGWILAYTAQSLKVLLISESFHGLGSNSIYAVTCLSMTEMIAPKYRDAFIQIYFVTSSISMALTGLMVQYLHWKTISIVLGIPMVFAMLIACMWPESPHWLAYKGEFAKCEKTFLWLRGTGADSKKELNELILAKKADRMQSMKYSFNDFWKTIRSNDFYVPCFHIFVLEYLVHGSGCIVMLVYSIELIKQTTTNENIVFLSSFIVNTILVIGYITTIAINKYFKKKTVLLTSIIVTVISLFSASASTYLQSIGMLPEDSLACFYSLIAFIVSISLGVMPVSYPIASALLPVKHRGIGGVLYVTNTCILHTLALKLAPYLFLHIHLWGTFILYAVNGICCGLIIWKFVPETKGRTLQEIEDFYKYEKFVSRNCETDNKKLEPMIVS